MKKLKEFTDNEKIKIFDKLWIESRNEFNESAKDEEHDEHYFWEWIMETILIIDKDDWEKHNEGEIIYGNGI